MKAFKVIVRKAHFRPQIFIVLALNIGEAIKGAEEELTEMLGESQGNRTFPSETVHAECLDCDRAFLMPRVAK